MNGVAPDNQDSQGGGPEWVGGWEAVDHAVGTLDKRKGQRSGWPFLYLALSHPRRVGKG